MRLVVSLFSAAFCWHGGMYNIFLWKHPDQPTWKLMTGRPMLLDIEAHCILLLILMLTVLSFKNTEALDNITSTITLFKLLIASWLTWFDLIYVHFSVSHLYGFGLVDAEAMVVEATKWRTVPPQHTCSQMRERRSRWGELQASVVCSWLAIKPCQKQKQKYMTRHAQSLY